MNTLIFQVKHWCRPEELKGIAEHIERQREKGLIILNNTIDLLAVVDESGCEIEAIPSIVVRNAE